MGVVPWTLKGTEVAGEEDLPGSKPSLGVSATKQPTWRFGQLGVSLEISENRVKLGHWWHSRCSVSLCVQLLGLQRGGTRPSAPPQKAPEHLTERLACP